MDNSSESKSNNPKELSESIEEKEDSDLDDLDAVDVPQAVDPLEYKTQNRDDNKNEFEERGDKFTTEQINSLFQPFQKKCKNVYSYNE